MCWKKQNKTKGNVCGNDRVGGLIGYAYKEEDIENVILDLESSSFRINQELMDFQRFGDLLVACAEELQDGHFGLHLGGVSTFSIFSTARHHPILLSAGER